MTLGEFKISKAYSLGIELELQLIDLSTFDLIAASPDLIYLLTNNNQTFPGTFTPEMTESMIEVCTTVHNDYDSLLAQLTQIRDILIYACDKLNIGICGGGTHPFSSWTKQKIFDKQRFNELSKRYGYLAKQFTVFGQHIHIGCSSGDNALYLLHALNHYLPHFIALAASSPFVQNNDTAFASARLNSVFAFPLSGHAPFILNWDEFDNNYFNKMCKTGTIKSMKDFYWDIRPKPEYGTIELRVCDTPLTITKAASLAAYLQAICRYIIEESAYTFNADDYLVYNHNRFQACKFGMDGILVNPSSYQQTTLSEEILATIEKIQPHAKELGSLLAIENIKQYVAMDNDATFLRNQLTQDGSTEYLVDMAMHKFANGNRHC